MTGATFKNPPIRLDRTMSSDHNLTVTFFFLFVMTAPTTWTLIEGHPYSFIESQGMVMPLRDYPNASNVTVDSPIASKTVSFLQKVTVVTPTTEGLVEPPWSSEFVAVQNELLDFSFYLPSVPIPPMKVLKWRASYTYEYGLESWIELQQSGVAVRDLYWESNWSLNPPAYENVTISPP